MAFHHYPPHTFHQRATSQHTQPHHYHYSISRSPSSSPPHSMSNSPHIHRSPHLYPSSLSSSSLTSRRRSSSSLSSSLPMRSHSTSTLSTGEDTPNISSPSPQSMLRSIDTSIPTSTTRMTSTPIPTHHRSQVMNKPTTHAPSSAPTQTSSSSTSATITPSTSAPQSSTTPDLLSQTLHIMSQHQDELSSRLLSLHENNKYKKQKIATLQSQYTLLQPSTHAPSLSITSCDDDENDYVVVNGCTDSEDDITLHNYCNTTYTCAAVAQDALRTMMSTYLHHIHQAETLSSQLDDELSCYQQKLHGMKLRMKCMGTLHQISCKIPEYQMHIDNMKQTANQRHTLRTTPAPS